MTDEELPIVAGRSIDHPLPSRDSEVRQRYRVFPCGHCGHTHFMGDREVNGGACGSCPCETWRPASVAREVAPEEPCTYRLTRDELVAFLARDRAALSEWLIENSNAADEAAENGDDPSPAWHRGVRHMADATLTWLAGRAR